MSLKKWQNRIVVFLIGLMMALLWSPLQSLALEVPPTVYEGVDYSAVYDYEYYTRRYTDIRNAFQGDAKATLEHFVSFGMKEGREGNQSFDVKSYKNLYPDLRAAFGQDLKAYYLHYIHYGQSEGRKTAGASSLQNPITVYKGVDYSKVYDFRYYYRRYTDIRQAFGEDDIKVLEHFVNFGMKEGRQGKESFEVKSYRNAYPDLRKAYGNDLKSYYLHYMNHGAKEGRSLTVGIPELRGAITVYNGIDYRKVYDYNYYLKRYPDIKRHFDGNDAAAIEHFATYGMNEARQAIGSFNVQSYKEENTELKKSYGANWRAYYLHYLFGDQIPSDSSGVLKIGKGYLYFEHGRILTDYTGIGKDPVSGKAYLFKKGTAQVDRVGVYEQDGKLYYLNSDASLKSGWVSVKREETYGTVTQKYYETYPYQRAVSYSDQYTRIIQERLKELGYSVSVDGEYSSATVEAVKAFQQSRNLVATGTVDGNTWKELYTVISARMVERQMFFDKSTYQAYQNGVKTIDGQEYLFTKDGMLSNEEKLWADSSSLYKASAEGVVTKAPLTDTDLKAVRVMDQLGWDMETLFNWVVTDWEYVNKDEWYPAYVSSGSTHLDHFANIGLSQSENHVGNCYVMNATVAKFAQLLGYDITFVEGAIGNGGRHGWGEIDAEGTAVILDAEFSNVRRGLSSNDGLPYSGYMRPYGAKNTWIYQQYAYVD